MPSRTDFTFCSRLSGLTTGTTRSGCGMNGSTITRARARYSFGSRAITRAARTSTPNATTARVFQRRRTAAQSSSIVYVRSMFPLSFHPRPRPREPSLESRLFPDQSQLRHVAVHLVRGGQVIDPRIAQGSRLDPQIARELPGEPDGVAFIEQAAGGAVGSVRAPDRRADAEEELLAHTQVPLAARAGPPGVTSLGRKHVAVSRIVGSERQRLRVDSVVDLRPGAERVLDLAAESRDEDVTLAGSQEQPEAGDGEWILRIRRAAAELELFTRREMHARRQRTGLVRREGSAGKAELLRVREPGQSRLAIGGDVQVVLAEEIELDARHGLAEPVGPRAVEQHVVVVPRHQRNPGPPFDVDLRARLPGREERGESHERRQPGRGHRHRSYGTTTVSPGPSVTLLLPVTRSSYATSSLRPSARSTLMLPRSANSASPPASASACSTPMLLRSGNAPGCPTMPVTKTRCPFTSWTMTVTCGSRTSEASCFCTVASSSRGVSPSALTSPSSGRVILPSGRMGTVRDSSGSFHTETSTTSSRLSRNSVMCCASSSCAAAAWETRTATANTAIQIPTPLDMLPPPRTLGARDRTPPEHAPCQRQLALLRCSLRSVCRLWTSRTGRRSCAPASVPGHRRSKTGNARSHARALRLLSNSVGALFAMCRCRPRDAGRGEGKGLGRCSEPSQQRPSFSPSQRSLSTVRTSRGHCRSRSCSSSWGRCSWSSGRCSRRRPRNRSRRRSSPSGARPDSVTGNLEKRERSADHPVWVPSATIPIGPRFSGRLAVMRGSVRPQSLIL